MINANEQRVIGAAKGTFKYKGEIYRARPVYVQQLIRKLDSKDIELTAEQASSAIQTMYGDIGRGVKEGYLQKLSEEQGKKAKKEGKVQKLETILLDNKNDKKKDKTGKNQEEKYTTENYEKKEIVEGADGKLYSVQEKPLDVTKLDQLRVADMDTMYSHTSNEQIVGQMNVAVSQMLTFAGISWVVCILVLSFYLKVLKHRGKAFLTLLGVSFMSLSIFVLGSMYVVSIRANRPEVWQTVAVESDYFKECTKIVDKDLQSVLTGINMESGVSVLGLDEDTVYRDVKSILSARLMGKDMPKFRKRRSQIRDALHSILPKESIENVNHVSDVLLERYCKVLDTPYAQYLNDLQSRIKSRNIICVVGCVVMWILALVFLWKGTKYVHRKFRALSYGFCVAGISMLVTALLNRHVMPSIQIEPNAYRLLFERYLLWCYDNILYLGLLLIFVGMFAWAACYVTKGKHIEKLGLK